MYAGDAVQKLLPRDFRVPYIGWHPVEDKMTPRNLYDHTKVRRRMKMFMIHYILQIDVNNIDDLGQLGSVHAPRVRCAQG